MQIPSSQLRWYAAFHDEGGYPHIHMMLWSDEPKYGFLRKDKLLLNCNTAGLAGCEVPPFCRPQNETVYVEALHIACKISKNPIFCIMGTVVHAVPLQQF